MKALALAAAAITLAGCCSDRSVVTGSSGRDAQGGGEAGRFVDVSSPPPRLPVQNPAAIARSCLRADPASPAPQPLDAGGAGSAIALARSGDRTIAYVADEDARAIRTVDIDARSELATTPLDARPGQLLVLPDGRVAVALADRSAVAILDPGEDAHSPLTERCRAEAPAEPVALSLSPDASSLLVASRWGHTLTAFSTSDLARSISVDLPRDPRAVVTSSDGRRAFVAHTAGARLSVVDLDPSAPSSRSLSIQATSWRPITPMMPMAPTPGMKTPRQRFESHQHLGGQGFTLVRATGGRIFAPEVLVEPHPPASSGGYGDSSSGLTAVGDVGVIDEAQAALSVTAPSAGKGPTDCLLPRAAAFDAAAGKLLVACMGIDAIVAYDASRPTPHAYELARWPVASGPTGIAVDDRSRRAVVWSQLGSAITEVSLDPPKFPAKAPPPVLVELRRIAPIPPEIAEGRRLFHSAGGRRIAFDGRACASCHPDGRDDAITWNTPDGPRQTPMLIGRLAGTAPYGWDGEHKELGGHFARTIQRLSGSGLTANERDAIFAYLASLDPPGAAAPSSDAKIDRGSAIFHSKDAGCSSCHLGDETTTDGALHDVKSATATDVHHRFDTPSLRFVGRSAPYFHDGRYATLPALLRGADGTMGHTSQLGDDGIDALAAYLETL